MKTSKLQCRNNLPKLTIMQTKLVTKYHPLCNKNRHIINSKEKKFFIRKTRIENADSRKPIVHLDKQTNRMTQIVSVNPMEAQSNALSRYIPPATNNKNVMEQFSKHEKNEKKFISASSKLKQFGSNHRFTGAIRKIIISKKSCLKRRNNKETLAIGKSDVRRNFSDFVPHPNAFVHILSAFISTSFETNLNCDCDCGGSLESLRALSRMLEDVPEENDLNYESSFAKPAISLSPKESNKSIATFVSPNEFSLDKSSSTTSHEMKVGTGKLENTEEETNSGASKIDEAVSNFSNLVHKLEKCIETDNDFPSESITSRENVFRKDNTENSNPDISEECPVIEDSFKTFHHLERDCGMQTQNSSSDFDRNQEDSSIPNNYNVGSIGNEQQDEKYINNEIPEIRTCNPEIESIFTSNCVRDHSRDECSISCPCFRDMDKYFDQSKNFYHWMHEGDVNQDEIVERESDSGVLPHENVEDESCGMKKTVGISTESMHEELKENSEPTPTKTSELHGNNDSSIIRNTRGRMNEQIIYLKCPSSLPDCSQMTCCYNTLKNQEKKLITLFSKNDARKFSRMKGDNNMLEDFKLHKDNNSIIEMENFKEEVLNFFDRTIEYEETPFTRRFGHRFEDLTLPSVKLNVPNFSQILTDIGRTTREKINQILAESTYHHRPRTCTKCDVKKLTLLYKK